ncbi:site-specific DNA-methyltransferase [Priestia megaterium]|uniref:DNA methyltransferase n=1 Tax=Priestia megaterium TaxID=1404 RepID=UPI003D2A6BE0
MKVKLQEELNSVLSVFPQYWDGETLLKNKVIEDLRNYKAELLSALLANETIKCTYSVNISGNSIFKVDDFVSMLRYRNYWENSYTKFSNEIGLTSEGKYLKYSTDIVLDFPHKDCILEGGMTTEEVDKKEIYYNKILAKEEMDILLSPKALSNPKRYTAQGEELTEEFGEKDNLIIKGNNLLALYTLKEKFAGKVKLIYIDPPYNTGGDSFKYNDRFNHSTWLTFMKNRLEIAKELLSENGAIFITLDDNELHYMKVLGDEIFGRNCFINTIVWRHSDNSNNNALKFSEDYNFILVYAKSPSWKPNFLNDLTKRSHFKNPDNDPRGPWFDGNPVNNPALRKNLQFNITAPNGNIIKHPQNGWRWSKETMDEKFKTGELRFSEDQTRVIRRTYLADMEGLPPSTLWTNLEVTGHTRKAKYELKRLFPDIPVTSLFSTPKPELLLKHVFDIATNEGDLVMDFFMGSATTQAVAMKMNRQFIGVEQMDYIETVSVPRLVKVIEGEQGGVSKEVNWKGEGSFVYAELHSLNHLFVSRIQNTQSDEELEIVMGDIFQEAFFDYKVNFERLTNEDSGFKALSLEEKKYVLIESLDANQMYLSYSEIDDEQYAISESVKQFNNSFYKGKVSGGEES